MYVTCTLLNCSRCQVYVLLVAAEDVAIATHWRQVGVTVCNLQVVNIKCIKCNIKY